MPTTNRCATPGRIFVNRMTHTSAPERLAQAKRLRSTADRAATWLVDRVGDDGKPVGADERNSWWRVPWALAISGHRGTAAALMSWAERTSLTDDGDLVEGVAGGGGPVTPVYKLSHLALAAHLLNRFDTSELVLRHIISTYYNDVTGGAFFYRDHDLRNEDMLFTSQVGLLATWMGRLDIANNTYEWFARLWDAQPSISSGRLYTTWCNGALLIDDARSNLVDFNLPQQHYFQPGAAGAFLASYASRSGRREAIELATRYMHLNIEGTPRQFDDPDSVHICKFGWGAAELLVADPDGGWEPYAMQMADWFVQRQRPDGAWDPSAFTLTAPATDLDRMWKTAEHLMETLELETALRGVPR